jgi:hypothetical protein
VNVPDGRYLARSPADRDREPADEREEVLQRVLVVETLGAPPPPARRRRRARPAEADSEPSALPLSRLTVVRAYEPFERPEEASAWLEGVAAEEEAVDALVAEGLELVNRALHASAAASAQPRLREIDVESATLVRIGYGSGEEVAAGRFSIAREVDVRGRRRSRRRRREEELRPQERLAGVLGGRERIDACETLLLRARADLDAGRLREAALQLRVGLEALLSELSKALLDPGHEEDMAQLEARRGEVGDAANMALRGDLDAERERNVRELLEICERVLRRRRILRG